MRKRTLFALCAAALVAVIGVTAALAGSGGRATPAKKPAKAADAASSSTVVESPARTSDAAAYWTEERMRSAGPLEMRVPGGSATTAPSAQVPKSANRASTAKAPNVTTAPAAKPSNATRSRTSDEGGTVSADSTDDAAAYWTPEQMENVTPMLPEVEGGNGSQGPAGPGPVPATP